MLLTWNELKTFNKANYKEYRAHVLITNACYNKQEHIKNDKENTPPKAFKKKIYENVK